MHNRSFLTSGLRLLDTTVDKQVFITITLSTSKPYTATVTMSLNMLKKNLLQQVHGIELFRCGVAANHQRLL